MMIDIMSEGIVVGVRKCDLNVGRMRENSLLYTCLSIWVLILVLALVLGL